MDAAHPPHVSSWYLLLSTTSVPPSTLHLIFLTAWFKVPRIRAQDLFGFRTSNSRPWPQDPWTGWDVTCFRSWTKPASDTSPEPLFSRSAFPPWLHRLYSQGNRKRCQSRDWRTGGSFGMRSLESGTVSCCFFNFLSGKWNTFHQKVGKDLEQNWSWLSKHLTMFCGKQPSVLGDISSRRYWWR